ncbi:MAG: manganese efflux pump [Candidatus Riflebacteria bacterium]|nr:manganese efflux pump [Candidatus Riflebacteria bacterium]
MSPDSALIVFGIAAALGCDAFAVGLAVGTRDPDRRQRFRLWFHFGLFQFLMTMGGWYLGRSVIVYIAAWDHWIAFGLLAFIALRMLRESLAREADGEDTPARSDPTRGWPLVALSFATSFDALGVGFGMSMATSSLVWESVVIGLVAAAMTWSGLFLGKRLSLAFGKRVETVGAIILLGIAFKLLEI